MLVASLLAVSVPQHGRSSSMMPEKGHNIRRDVHLGLPVYGAKEVSAAEIYVHKSGAPRAAGTRPDEEETNAMLAIIEDNFKDVPETKDVFPPGGTTGMSSQLMPSWAMCSQIDYGAQSCLKDSGSFLCQQNTFMVKQAAETLGIEACFFGDDGTISFNGEHGGLCRAVNAFIRSTDELTKKHPSGPALANHDVVGWNTNNVPAWAKAGVGGPHVSWRNGSDYSSLDPWSWSTNTTYMAVNTSEGCCAGNATYQDIGDPYYYNAVTGYSLCDIARTVLQQNANQVGRSNCAPTGYFNAIAIGAPVYALKKSLELFWTGELTSLGITGCPNRFSQSPGLIQPNTWAGCSPTMSAADCAAAQNAPQTAAGITWSWESTLSQYSKWADHPNLTCDDMDRPDGQLPTGILLQPYMSPAVEGVITPNDQASTNSMVRMCKGLINSDDDQCNMFELQQPKVVNTSEVDPSNNNFSWAVVGTEEAIEANKKIMDQVCDMVDAGGFAVFGVAAHILNSWPTATMAPIVNLGEGPIYPGGRNQTIVDTAKDQGPLAKCELPNLAPWDDGKRTFADVIGDCMHYMDTACAHPKFDEETHRQQICTNLHGPNSYCLSSDLPRQITPVHWEIDGSQVVAQPELFSIDHAIALTRCHDEPNIGMTYTFATWGQQVRVSQTLALSGMLVLFTNATNIKGYPPIPTTCNAEPSPTSSPPSSAPPSASPSSAPPKASPSSAPPSASPSSGGGGDSGCFAKETTTACLLSAHESGCEHVLMTDLAVGDLVLGREGATTVVAVQHKAVDTIAELLTFETTDGTVSMTPDHAVFADGELVAAAKVKVGSLLSNGAVKYITKSEGAIINVVTASGTIFADGSLAASNPMWIASIIVDAPITRAIVTAALYAAGDVETVAAGFCGVLAKVATTTAVAIAAVKALKKQGSK